MANYNSLSAILVNPSFKTLPVLLKSLLEDDTIVLVILNQNEEGS